MVMSDGTRSHPNSRRFPAPGLRDLRERETLAALAMLGIAEDFATFLRFPDGDVPTPISSRFGDAVSLCRAYCAAVAPQTVLLPWRRDPHRDHRATHQVMMAALAQMQPMPRVLEYPIWLWMLAADGDDPLVDEVCAWRLDTSQVMQQKKAAIAAYRSQTTNLIDDDPDGFRLLPEHLLHFTQPWEIFFEAAGMPPVLAPEWKGATADV
jgi:LmbE family N-acetylglucosaminyl deacetylase